MKYDKGFKPRFLDYLRPTFIEKDFRLFSSILRSSFVHDFLRFTVTHTYIHTYIHVKLVYLDFTAYIFERTKKVKSIFTRCTVCRNININTFEFLIRYYILWLYFFINKNIYQIMYLKTPNESY